MGARRAAFRLGRLPAGPDRRPTRGGRTWNNDADTAKRIVDATLAALERQVQGARPRARQHPHRLQRGRLHRPADWPARPGPLQPLAHPGRERPVLVRRRAAAARAEPRRRSAASTSSRARTTRSPRTPGAPARCSKTAHIRVRVKIAPGMGHEVPADRMITNYRRPLRWLVAARLSAMALCWGLRPGILIRSTGLSCLLRRPRPRWCATCWCASACCGPSGRVRRRARAARSGERVEEVILELGLVGETDMLKSLATHYKVYFISSEKLSQGRRAARRGRHDPAALRREDRRCAP